MNAEIAGTRDTYELNLANERRLDSSAAVNVARSARQTALGHVRGGTTTCGGEGGGAVIVAFQYDRSSDVDLWLQTGPCAIVRNGAIVGSGAELSQAIQSAR